MISNILSDFPYSLNQPLKSAHDEYIWILKNIINKIEKARKKIGHCDWVTEHVVIFVCI
jgi:hypothetical protein